MNTVVKTLKAQMLKSRRAVHVLTGAAAEQVKENVSKKELLTALEQRRQQYKKRKKEHGDRSEEVNDSFYHLC
jgi:hypothetical protein